jgi:hypothetical protein
MYIYISGLRKIFNSKKRRGFFKKNILVRKNEAAAPVEENKKAEMA